jgi:hypothetical protein
VDQRELEKKKKSLQKCMEGSRMEYALSKTALIHSHSRGETNQELKNRRQTYLLRSEQRKYAAMVTNITGSSRHDLQPARFLNDTYKHMTVVANLILAVFATAGVSYYVGMQLEFSNTKCALLALSGAITMMILETVLIIIRLEKI